MLLSKILAQGKFSHKALLARVKSHVLIDGLTIKNIQLEPLLINAARHGATFGVEDLIKQGANVDVTSSIDGQTALIAAATKEMTSEAILLIGAGANINIRAKSGSQAIHHAARCSLQGF